MMDRHELAFLNAALGASDPRIEARLTAGFYLIRDCARIADAGEITAESHTTRENFEAALVKAQFDGADPELDALTRLESTLRLGFLDRCSLFSALLAYAVALARNGLPEAAEVSFELLERLWGPDCGARDRLQATFLHSLLLLRSLQPIAQTAELPLLLAWRARAARSSEYLGFARVLRNERTYMAGNLPLALGRAERLLEWARARGIRTVEGHSLVHLGCIHGRAGRYSDALRFANLALADDLHFTVRLSGLSLIANAFTDLGDYPSAQAAFELLLLAPTALHRVTGWIGLMDLWQRQGNQVEFERVFERAVNLPMPGWSRIDFMHVAGKGWAKADRQRAHALLEQAHTLSRRCGLGLEILRTEQDIAGLPEAKDTASARAVMPVVAAHVNRLRATHAASIAACLA